MKKKMMKLFSIVIVFVLSFSFCRSVSFAHYAGTDSYWDSFSSDYYYRQMNKAQKELYDRLYKECMDILTTEKDCTNYDSGDYYNRDYYKGDYYDRGDFDWDGFDWDGYDWDDYDGDNYDWDDYDGDYYDRDYDDVTYYTDYVEYDESLGSYDDELVTSVFFAFTGSNPQFYFLAESWSGKRQYSGSSNRYYLALSVYGDFVNGSDRKSYTQKFKTAIDTDVKAVNAGKTMLEKETIAHDLIAKRITYDDKKWSQSSASVFLTKSSVCAGYSEGLELLLNAVGFECVPVTSETHEWNQVKLDGTWYAVDVTWDDDDDYGTVGRDFFNVSDKTLLAYDRKEDSDGAHVKESFYKLLNLPSCDYDYPDKDPNAKPDDPEPVDPDPVDPDPVDPDPVDPDPVDPDPVKPDYPGGDGTGADDYGLTGTFTNEDGDTALFRVYNPNTWEHFYTTDVAERRSLILAGWQGEGIIAYFPTYDSADTNIMFRFRNPNTGDHHYTSDQLEMMSIMIAGWVPEGTSFYSQRQGNGIPVYRLYNPNAVTGTHHYTSNKAEKDHLVSLGWKYEGISWYAASTSYYKAS